MTDEQSNRPDDREEYRVETDAKEILPLWSGHPHGPQRAQLFAALAQAQGEIQLAEANQEAKVVKDGKLLYTFKYADLAACLAVIREPLSKNGLALIQIPTLGDDNAVNLESILGHESGEQISCFMTMTPDKSGPQAVGTCIAYLRRYSLCALIGVAQYDDDAASATKDPGDYERLSPRDIDELLMKADELFGEKGEKAAEAVLQDMVETVFEKKHIGDIPKDQLAFALKRLVNKKGRDDKKAAKLEADTKKADADREPGADDE